MPGEALTVLPINVESRKRLLSHEHDDDTINTNSEINDRKIVPPNDAHNEEEHISMDLEQAQAATTSLLVPPASSVTELLLAPAPPEQPFDSEINPPVSLTEKDFPQFLPENTTTQAELSWAEQISPTPVLSTGSATVGAPPSPSPSASSFSARASALVSSFLPARHTSTDKRESTPPSQATIIQSKKKSKTGEIPLGQRSTRSRETKSGGQT
jgi:hypothetical protein